MILMVCSSVFQLYVTIIIKEVFLQDKDVDLILTDSTPVFKSLHTNEKLKSLFHSVRFVAISENIANLNRLEKSRYGKKFFELFPRRYAKKVWETDVKKYNECYFSSYTYVNIMLQYGIKRNRKGVKVHLFEDGISTYLLKSLKQIEFPNLIKKIFRICTVEELVDDVYVFEPELVCIQEYKKFVNIPKPQEVEGINNLLCEIFSQSDYEIKEKFVFFEESFNNDGYITNDSELINMLWTLCEEKDFILKHHPRNRTDRFKAVLPTVDAPIFWENYLLNHSIDNHVLVTVSSNTVFVPHIIAGSQPTVIMLYKIFNGTSPLLGSGNFDAYVEKYLKYYEDYTSAKFYIPETVEEFQAIIQKLKRKNEV